jgi:hypothetical protein
MTLAEMKLLDRERDEALEGDPGQVCMELNASG